MLTRQKHSEVSLPSDPSPIPDLMRAMAEELNELQFLAAQFSDRVQQAAQSFSARLKVVEEALAAQTNLPNSITIDAAQAAPVNGFYDIEYEETGRAFRWSGPGRDFSFTLGIDRSVALRLRLHLIAMIDSRSQSELLLLVNGVSVPIRMSEVEEGLFECEATIPADADARTTHVLFDLPCVLRPKNNEEDTRLLGVAFRELQVFPVEEEKIAETPVAARQDSIAGLNESLQIHFPTATATDVTQRKPRRQRKSRARVATSSSGSIEINAPHP